MATSLICKRSASDSRVICGATLVECGLIHLQRLEREQAIRSTANRILKDYLAGIGDRGSVLDHL
jgi:hypothetical protein